MKESLPKILMSLDIDDDGKSDSVPILLRYYENLTPVRRP